MAREFVAPSRAAQLATVVLSMLLVATMLPVVGIQSAFADEVVDAATNAASEGLLYKVTDGKATLVGFEEGASLDGDIVVPETVDGATVTAVEMAEGQVAENVTSLTLPQTVESVKTEGLAAAFPSLASIEVDGTQGVYSTSGGMLFLQGKDAASSDGSTTLAKNRELVWAPPALVVARLPIECKSIAPGAFVDAAALETVMCPGVMESIAVAEKDDEGNVTKPGAFTDEQIASLSIVVPGTNIASPSGDRVSASVALSEDEGMEAKREAWWKHGFDSDKIVMGTSFGEVEGVVAVNTEGVAEDPSIDVLKPYEKKELAEAAESGDAEAAEKLAAPEGSGLSFSYNADMNLSVSWAGDKTATPATIEIPAYVTIDGVKYAVTEIAPEAFKGAVFLTSVTIPEGVRVVGESAFENCSNLKEVSLPSTLRTIDYAAFRGCAALGSIDIPINVTVIGGEAFADCGNLSAFNLKGSPYLSEAAVDPGLVPGYLLYKKDEAREVFDHASEDSIASYATAGRGGTLANLNQLIRMHPGKTSDGRFSGFEVKNDTASAFSITYYEAYSTDKDSLAYDHLSETTDSTLKTAISPGSSTLCGTWMMYSEVWVTVLNNYQLSIGGHNGKEYYAMTLSLLSWPDSLKNRISLNGFPIATFPAFTVVSTSSVERFSLTVSNKREIQFQSNLPSTPSGFVTSVWYPEGVDLATVNPAELMTPPAGLRFAGWGLVNADGTRTYVDQRNEEGRLIAPAEATTYFAMWGYDVEYWSRDGSTKLSEATYLLGDPNATFSADNGIDSHPGYELRGWATAPNSSVTAGFGLGSNLGSAFDPRNFTLDKVDDCTYKLYAAYTPNKYNIRYEGNGGTWLTESGEAPTGKQYTFGEGTELSVDIKREGYWFMGWTPPKEAAVAGDCTSENSEMVKAAGTDWYGNVVLTAVWKPKTYTLAYDISKAADSSISILPGDSKTFVHPSAVADIQNLSYDEGNLADCRENNRCIDLSDIGQAHKAEYLDMAMAALSGDPAGYEFHGWVKPDYIAGTSPDGDATWDVNEEGWHTFAKSVVDALWTNQDDVSTNDPAENKATVYGIYKALGTTAITLKANGPVGAPDAGTQDPDGKKLSWASGSGDEVVEQAVYYWSKKGLVNTAAGQTSQTGYVDGAGQNLSTWDVNGSTNAAGIDRKALARYGYRFCGWGVQGADRASDVVYIAYNEDDRQFTLTDAGSELVKGGWNAGASVTPTGWDAIWEIRTYEITLRLPAPAVKDVRLADEATAKANYEWWETKDDANSSWYTAVKKWNYWDKFTVPYYELRSGFNTYEGWYRDSDHSGSVVVTHAQGVNGSDPAMTAGDTIFRVSPDKLPAGPSGGTMVETDLSDNDPATDPDGAVTLWMCYTPIYIDVTAPVGVFLAENDAYVVGSDKRTDLETAAKFTVKGQTHDLVLTGVTATDVVSGEVGDAQNAHGINTYPVSNLVATGDEGATDPGLCEQMFKIYNPSVHNDKLFGTLGSRIFWVSPKSTVTNPDATHDDMTGTKDTDARRYFGFTSADNTLVDNQKETGDDLDGFKLKKDATTADAKGGLEVLGTETASDGSTLSKTYRFFYGLDLRKTDFNLGTIQKMVEGDSEWNYNTAYKKPLVKVMFTFAVEQRDMVAYSARFGETVDGETVARATSGAAGDGAAEIVVG